MFIINFFPIFELWIFLIIFLFILTALITISRYLYKKQQEKSRRELRIEKELYKRNLMKDYGVEREAITKNSLICPICDIFADENNICPKCNRKL